MLGALKVQAMTAAAAANKSCEGGSSGEQYPLNLRLNNRMLFTSLSLRQQSQLTESSQHHLTSIIGSSSPPPASIQLNQWTITDRHIRILNFIACAAAISATWLFCSAIPALLAFKRAAESMEKLMDVTREELPDTMAAVRLSGMEISDLTMELSDLGQEITQGVRSSTRAVRLAEERLRRFTTKPLSVSMQTKIAGPMESKVAGPMETKVAARPTIAKTARNMREGIVKGRAILQMLFTLTCYSGIVFNFFKTRTKDMKGRV